MSGVAGGFLTYGQSARSVWVGGGVGDSEAAVGVDGPRRGLVYAWVEDGVRRAGVDEDFEVWTRSDGEVGEPEALVFGPVSLLYILLVGVGADVPGR